VIKRGCGVRFTYDKRSRASITMRRCGIGENTPKTRPEPGALPSWATARISRRVFARQRDTLCFSAHSITLGKSYPLLSVADKIRSLLTHRDVIKSPGALLRDGKAVSAFISIISQWRPLTGSHPKLRI